MINLSIVLSNFLAICNQSSENRVTLLILLANDALEAIVDFGSSVNVFVVILH